MHFTKSPNMAIIHIKLTAEQRMSKSRLFGHFKGNFETLPRALYIIQPLFRGKKPPEKTRIYKLVQKCFGIFSKTFAE